MMRQVAFLLSMLAVVRVACGIPSVPTKRMLEHWTPDAYEAYARAMEANSQTQGISIYVNDLASILTQKFFYIFSQWKITGHSLSTLCNCDRGHRLYP